MSRITSKLQVTLPKRIADQYHLRPGADVTFEAAGAVILLRPTRTAPAQWTVEERLALFDAASARIDVGHPPPPTADRGWTREELYERARTD
jgi:AbrB family looped-hinge helix DNA binding protein